MSLRESASWPSTCSGAMYWNVPTIIPAAVSGWLASGVAKVAVSPETGATDEAFASPKSISLAPDLVSMTFPGFKSR